MDGWKFRSLPLVIGHWSLVIRSRSAPRAILHGTPRGIVYPLLLLGILIIGVATAGVAEVWSTQVKREKEEELLFRLGAIRLAIARFRADHTRLPKELKDLVEDPSQAVKRHYLRRVYPDPMTGKPDWKLDLVADRAGVVSGIQDVHSQSTGKPLKVFTNTTKPINSYQDW
jgi:type II secretory pathway pseudopilin PulG